MKPDTEVLELLAICRERNELDFLFEITKQIAEADSIGEGWGYCSNYTREDFNNGQVNEKGELCDYVESCSIYVYQTYLKHIKA